MKAFDSTRRFSDRVDHYTRNRPDYPRALIAWLREAHGLRPSWVVADIGAGTGISSRMFLQAGNPVIAVEPNAPMRAAADRWLGSAPDYRSVDGTAESTRLDSGSVDLISAAQAFHWFDPEAVRAEWSRILRPKGMAAIYWNVRRETGTLFLEEYESLLRRHCPEYRVIAERHADRASMETWFGPGYRGDARFDHRQAHDLEGFLGRVLSSSYVPAAGHPGHAPIMEALRALFDRHAQEGRIHFDYDTRIFVGEVALKVAGSE